MPIPDLVRTAYEEYLYYIQSNPRLRIPDHIHDPAKSVGKVHASAIGRCPLNAAKSRETEKVFDLSTLHLMQQGVRDAEPIQEAMWWKYPIDVIVEHSVEKLPFRGRFDILYCESVIELKRRDGYRRKDGSESPPQPRLTDVYQMIAYSYMTGYEDIWLCLVTRFNLYFWKLVSDIGGFILVDEQGERWKSEYNNPSYLNYDVILAEANVHQQYLSGERDDDPLPFFLNHRGWECGSFVDNAKPKRFKNPINGSTGITAQFQCTCPFFAQCKRVRVPASGLIEVEEIEYGSKNYRILS